LVTILRSQISIIPTHSELSSTFIQHAQTQHKKHQKETKKFAKILQNKISSSIGHSLANIQLIAANQSYIVIHTKQNIMSR